MKQKTAKKLEVIFEFLVFGIVVGVIEDMIAVTVVSGEPMTWRIVGIITVIAIPFAILGELIADNVDFIKLAGKLRNFFGRGTSPSDTSGIPNGEGKEGVIE